LLPSPAEEPTAVARALLAACAELPPPKGRLRVFAWPTGGLTLALSVRAQGLQSAISGTNRILFRLMEQAGQPVPAALSIFISSEDHPFHELERRLGLHRHAHQTDGPPRPSRSNL
jgi:hypothetical protein